HRIGASCRITWGTASRVPPATSSNACASPHDGRGLGRTDPNGTVCPKDCYRLQHMLGEQAVRDAPHRWPPSSQRIPPAPSHVPCHPSRPPPPRTTERVERRAGPVCGKGCIEKRRPPRRKL